MIGASLIWIFMVGAILIGCQAIRGEHRERPAEQVSLDIREDQEAKGRAARQERAAARRGQTTEGEQTEKRDAQASRDTTTRSRQPAVEPAPKARRPRGAPEQKSQPEAKPPAGFADQERPGGSADSSKPAVTPLDQSETQADLELTRRIRKALIEDESLSLMAKNIQIVTVDGQVTLQGRVNTAEEASRILVKARTLAGPRVHNRLTVAQR